jgi:methionine biosynthesis protein MetW
MTAAELLRGDLRLVSSLVPAASRVLDLGCGDGALLAHLRDAKGCVVRGVELSATGVEACVGRGIPVVQADIDAGLSALPDGAFDVVVLSQTLQVVRHPDLVLREIVRVGREGIVSFPNFAHWRARGYLGFRGRMPMSAAIPYSWYSTPNIHHTTVKDFRAFCRENGARIVSEIALAGGSSDVRRVRVWPNLLADTAVAVVTSANGDGVLREGIGEWA